jgi:hypothetical protein
MELIASPFRKKFMLNETELEALLDEIEGSGFYSLNDCHDLAQSHIIEHEEG